LIHGASPAGTGFLRLFIMAAGQYSRTYQVAGSEKIRTQAKFLSAPRR
jgi:hypothetical protein